ncbi:MAG TPA: SUF system NifU family Fe-S cluster assembly protein [Thermomicrobiales bacterium]|jgi:nitrogen fixation NifU-like protein|nr:SUF system NifU family Fe-S cluster assembly protein [Thermomicrobiales bacterium]
MTDSTIYREVILEHSKHPNNYGTLDPNDYSFEDTNPLCGDEVRIDVRSDGDKISEIAFSGQGCAISQASASILMELVEGKSLDDIRAMGKDELLDELGITLSPARLKCALLSFSVLKTALFGREYALEALED